jgi:SAM-dependent methyltransferase
MSAPTAKDLIPPEDALPGFARGGNFEQTGAAFLETARERGLEPGHRILDLGCGVGRFAVAVAGYLNDEGSYVGLDTAGEFIDICDEYIGSKVDGFQFVHAEIFNTHYNRNAAATAAEFRFPFDDAEFDFVFSNSLFTHLVPADADNYFREIGRVLRPGGRTLNTIYLLNEESSGQIDDGTSKQGEVHPFAEGLARVKKPDNPEAWIALDEAYVRRAHADAGLEIEDPIRYGGWTGREPSGPGFGGKDIVVAVKV